MDELRGEGEREGKERCVIETQKEIICYVAKPISIAAFLGCGSQVCVRTCMCVFVSVCVCVCVFVKGLPASELRFVCVCAGGYLQYS